jgi:PIN domain nuclease of toxin-antitoxin system
MPDGGLLLDTCALVWLVGGDPRLSEAARSRIDQSDLVFVSAISAWEVSLLTQRGRLELPLDALGWFRAAVDHHGLTLAPLTLEVLVGANGLPWHHRDPADRFIIATAQARGVAVVTSDRRFEDYGIDVLA